MDNPTKVMLPPPNFIRRPIDSPKYPPHLYLTPSGMTGLPRERQPPPMYGPRGATVPAKYHKENQWKKQKPYPAGNAVRQFCESCDIELQEGEDLHKHRTQHENCPVDGCKYQGHPTVMDKHVTTLHSSGLFGKFKKLSTPEEIAAWRDERRKRYPTVANVLMKERSKEQRQKRGERLEANKSRFGKREDYGRMQNIQSDKTNQKGGRGRDRKRRHRRSSNKKNSKTTVKPEDEVNKSKESIKKVIDDPTETKISNGIPEFKGIYQMDARNNLKVEKAENALSSLISMYGSESSDDDHEEDKSNEKSSQTETNANPSNVLMKHCEVGNTEQTTLHVVRVNEESLPSASIQEVESSQNTVEFTPQIENCTNRRSFNESSDELPDELPIVRHSDLPLKCDYTKPEDATKTSQNELSVQKMPQKHVKKLQRQMRIKCGLDYRKLKLRKQNTMLEKLLEPDIRHERNVLLQCVRFVCENNFFGIGGIKKD